MAETKKQKFVVIDGNALLHRAWHALPPLTTKAGQVVSAVYGFALILLKVLREIRPEYVVVAFDRKAPTFRHKEFKEYKAKRVKQPQELYDQIKHVKELLGAFNIPFYEKDGYEADDIIGTVVARIKAKVLNLIVTGDLDALQLVDKNTQVYTLRKGITDTVIYDEKKVLERYGLGPEQLIDFKALRGDPSDNIPGVRGIGEKTALTLIKTYGSLEKVYQNINKIKEKTRQLLLKHKKDAMFSKKLVVRKVPFKFELEDARWPGVSRDKVVDLFRQLEFKSLLKQVALLQEAGKDITKKETEIKVEYHIVDDSKKFNQFLRVLKQQKAFALDTETTELNPFGAEILGISFSWEGKEAYYIPISSLKSKILNLKSILEDPNIKKYGHNFKFDIEVLANLGINLKGVSFDTMIASYILNPGSRAHDLDTLIFNHFGYERSKLEPPQHSCEDADFIWRLVNILSSQIKKKDLLSLLQKIEMPLIPVLARMEANGIKVNIKLLKKLSRETAQKLAQIESQIYKLAGTKFNIASPQQLRRVLFEKLKIPTEGIKKGKTGFSTAVAELEKLKAQHPIINFIFQYRELFKLKTTYLDALPELVNPKTGRIHTSFNQTITATGRLSSSNPNLQNIPARTELGRKIRQAFVAQKGFKFFSADYSQIDLRIIASVADDKKMIDTFKRDEDIHRQIAAEINDVELDEVTPQMRQDIKTISFGLIYGMSPYGFAQATGMTQDGAQEFMEKYFKLHPAIKEYMNKTITKARKYGYVATLFGRKRWLPEINSGVTPVRRAAERMAINLPIQGTTADLIKIAMIAIDPSFKLLLQVHDELLFEVPENKIKEVAEDIKEIMENPPIKLKVPIKVNMLVGDNWGELTSL
jgi:DNA polymerase-1